jgi:arylsulfatase A-like enzyme
MSTLSRALLSLPLIGLSALAIPALGAADDPRPNILWITAEDHGPHLGAYGDTYAFTPRLDAFAARSLRYNVVWSDAPVCAPARTSLITGVYPTNTGAHHMRSDVRLPPFMSKYPQLLRAAGYYCTNNHKEDYNVSVDGQVWDESSRQAHYLNRAEGQPFFAIFNFHESHEARIRDRTDLPHHDPAEAPIPAYHPDTPEVRRDWAQYYHGVTRIDERVGEVLAELMENGLADRTIVFFYSDHGSGMPRHKRWAYNSGLHVPLIVHIPEKFRHLAPPDYAPGASTRRPVAFVDLAPTLLSLIGEPAPDWMQGHAFMGPHEAKPREYLFGFRGRMDERTDMVRTVRNDRYIYIRNYMPHLIYGQYLATMFRTPTTGVWHSLYEEGQLEPPQTSFWEPKPEEELYDLWEDPDEVKNLAGTPEHENILQELREVLQNHILEVRDAGFLPEAEMHRRAGHASIYEMAHDHNRYPLEEILAMAETAARRDGKSLPQLMDGLHHEDPAIRYWAISGIRLRGVESTDAARELLRKLLTDANPSVRIAAAEALIAHSRGNDVEEAVRVLLALAPPDENGVYVSLAAMTVLADLEPEQQSKIRPRLEKMPLKDPRAPDRANDYVHRHVRAILATEP